MRPIERVRKMNSGETIDRVPFMPTLYEHCASLIDKTPSQVARSKELLIKSQITAYEAYQHDLVTVGLDIYNVEVEALGGKIIFPENSEIPGLRGHPLAGDDNLNNLEIPDPEKDGRMPLFLEAAEAIKREIGKEVLVNGTIVGPFTLAALLRGFENFIMDLMTFSWGFSSLAAMAALKPPPPPPTTSTSKKFVIGCGVVSFNTPKNQLLLFKQAVEDYYKHQ